MELTIITPDGEHKVEFNMKIVVIESPYAGNVPNNIQYARKCLLDSLRRGEAPFASHLLYTQCLCDLNSVERELGILAGFQFRRVASLTAVYTDFGISHGMQLGIDDAKKINQRIEYREINH